MCCAKLKGALSMNLKDMSIRKQGALPKQITREGLRYRLNEETQTYHAAGEREPLGMYGEILEQIIREHNPLNYQYLMAEGQLTAYLAEANEACFQITESYFSRITEPEPEDYLERVQWKERHSMTAKELAMEELNRRAALPNTSA